MDIGYIIGHTSLLKTMVARNEHFGLIDPPAQITKTTGQTEELVG